MSRGLESSVPDDYAGDQWHSASSRGNSGPRLETGGEGIPWRLSSDEGDSAALSIAGSSVHGEGSEVSSPPEKSAYLKSGSQASGSSRKRDRTGSIESGDRTTGYYVGRRREIERLNAEKKKALKLDREKVIRAYSHIELLKKAKINVEEIKSKVDHFSKEELVRRANANMEEVLRIARSSTNLKGSFQGGLKTAAAVTLGIISVLKDRVSMSQEEVHLEEVRSLKREVNVLRQKLETEVESERRKALESAGEAEAYRSQLELTKKELANKELAKKSPSKRTPSAKFRASRAAYTSDSEVMQVDDLQPRVVLDPPDKWPVASIPLEGGRVRIVKEDPKLQKRIYEENIRYLKEREASQMKNGKTQTSKGPASNRRDERIPPGESPRAIADMIREIVAEEIGKALGKPVVREKPRITKVEVIKPAKTVSHERSGGLANAGKSEGANTVLGSERWSSVVGRRSKQSGAASSTPKKKAGPNLSVSQQGRKAVVQRRAPRMAAIQISCRGDISHAQVMSIAKQRVDIGALGIEDIRPRKARTGALLLEIPGKEGQRKADSLAVEMRRALQDHEDVLISRPEKMVELRLRDLEASVSADDVRSRVVELTGCDSNSVKVGEINISFNGLGTLWLRCPVVAANKLAKERRIRIGWTMVRVDMLPDRPLQCYRCLEVGHVRSQCRGPVDRSDRCYRCSGVGHIAKNCLLDAFCAICEDRGFRADHRVGSSVCKPGTGRVLPARSVRPAARAADNSVPMEGDNNKDREKRTMEKVLATGREKAAPMETAMEIEVVSDVRDSGGSAPGDWSHTGDAWGVVHSGDPPIEVEKGAGGAPHCPENA
ncbi:PREDICTED: uncharacterized protein LOC108781203 [Cyphomyrmex costatus]|uniref:uncharacterized protein LOC108781202 n=1 Tax=Cyphomyrmex costatus TaxID=456900 RepID=UPI000852379C|nr:PREDICTED: uncharacterized protein LOC108781202 [Cyphomyrmex costatus]XP_018404620.1 PREDICTED: uncharacterized protein LOC108781203 [Cyphomyrmex costatus]